MGTDLLGDIRREIDARLQELQPALEEYKQLLRAADALGLDSTPAPKTQATRVRRVTARRAAARPKHGTDAATDKDSGAKKAPRAVRGAAREAILGALEHGSHTVGELVVVTAMGTANVNGNLRKLAAEGVVAKTQREGKTAWSLVAAD